MVTFVSLFLWLVVGVQTVEVAVDHGVASVVPRLDGELVATISGEPWKAKVDFGELLEPHELEAVALDGNGEPVDRTLQVVNLPRPPAEARIVLDHDDTGRPTSIRVVTQSSEQIEPVIITATLDGKTLEPDGPNRFEIPEHDPTTIHLLSAEAAYANGFVARADVSVGGSFGEFVASELTAVPVQAADAPPTAAALEGRLTINGKGLRIVAVERSGARIYVVRDLGDQWIVWVEGSHLVNRIKLDGGDLGLELAGR
jgi:hypothetical protein